MLFCRPCSPSRSFFFLTKYPANRLPVGRVDYNTDDSSRIELTCARLSISGDERKTAGQSLSIFLNALFRPLPRPLTERVKMCGVGGLVRPSYKNPKKWPKNLSGISPKMF